MRSLLRIRPSFYGWYISEEMYVDYQQYADSVHHSSTLKKHIHEND